MMTRIPKDLSREDVLASIAELRSGRKSRWATSKKWVLLHEGDSYSPKAVLGVAICLAKGVDEWDVTDFSGGEPTNRVLRSLGFEIIDKGPESR